ncbi:MAG: hypothetical protein JXX14_24365 [Deltaproteobacteria bacterium]|nr:hypothetical protein [Deltaproteobacteria bacterium]
MKQDEKILAQYYDDELSDAMRTRVRAQIESSPEDTDALTKLETISHFFEVMKKENLENVSFEGFEKRILNEIHSAREPVPFSEKVGVWLKEFLSHRKAVWIPAASVAGAAFAALLVVGLQATSVMMPEMPSQNGLETWQANGTTPSVVSTVDVTAPDNIDVQEFNLETEGGQRIAVVWINE